MVEPRRNVGEIHELRELRAHGLPATLRMSSEIAEPARVRWNPDRRHTIVGSERVTAECAGRFLVDGRGRLLVAHDTLLNVPPPATAVTTLADYPQTVHR